MTEDMNKMTDTTTADQPPAPNGHGTGNGVSNGEPKQGATAQESAATNTASSPRKTKAERRAEKKAAAATANASTPVVTTTAAPGPVEPESVQPAATTTATPTSTMAESIVPPIATVSDTPVEVPVEVPVERLRIRMKIWTHPQTTKRYLMPTAYMRDVRNGQPVTDVMVAYAMSEDDTMMVTLTATQWNSLPFFYMQEDGAAPRATARPFDVVTSRARPG